MELMPNLCLAILVKLSTPQLKYISMFWCYYAVTSHPSQFSCINDGFISPKCLSRFSCSITKELKICNFLQLPGKFLYSLYWTVELWKSSKWRCSILTLYMGLCEIALKPAQITPAVTPQAFLQVYPGIWSYFSICMGSANNQWGFSPTPWN